MGILTSLAAAKYLFSGSGSSGSSSHYVPPSPEEIAEMHRRALERQQEWESFKNYMGNTHIGKFMDSFGDGLYYFLFESPNWWWPALLAVLISILAILFIELPEATVGRTRKQNVLYYTLCFAGTFTLGLLALETVVMVIRGIIWLFSPAV